MLSNFLEKTLFKPNSFYGGNFGDDIGRNQQH